MALAFLESSATANTQIAKNRFNQQGLRTCFSLPILPVAWASSGTDGLLRLTSVRLHQYAPRLPWIECRMHGGQRNDRITTPTKPPSLFCRNCLVSRESTGAGEC